MPKVKLFDSDHSSLAEIDTIRDKLQELKKCNGVYTDYLDLLSSLVEMDLSKRPLLNCAQLFLMADVEISAATLINNNNEKYAACSRAYDYIDHAEEIANEYQLNLASESSEAARFVAKYNTYNISDFKEARKILTAFSEQLLKETEAPTHIVTKPYQTLKR